MATAMTFFVDGKDMTVREIRKHRENVHNLTDGQIRSRLAAGDDTLVRLLRPINAKHLKGSAPEVPMEEMLLPVTKKPARVSDGSTAEYYELPEGARELQDLISYKSMNAQIGEVFRASYRYGQVAHSAKLRDAKKMRFYIDAEIERLEKYGDS